MFTGRIGIGKDRIDALSTTLVAKSRDPLCT